MKTLNKLNPKCNIKDWDRKKRIAREVGKQTALYAILLFMTLDRKSTRLNSSHIH